MVHAQVRTRLGRLFAVAAVALGVGLTAPAQAQEAGAAGSRVSGSAGIDFTTHYFFRGILQEEKGTIAQPYAELVFNLHQGEGAISKIDLIFGTWHSFHDNDTGAATANTRAWYEADIYTGLSFEIMKDVELGVTWTAYGSPNDAFSTVHDINLSIGYKGDNAVGFFNPTAEFIFEFDGQADGGNSEGVLLQLSISPEIEIIKGDQPVTLAIPVVAGLSLSEYYESPTPAIPGADTEDSTFGYLDVGIVASTPLSIIPKDYGDWSVSVGVHFVWLGSTAREFNTNNDFEIVGTAGISMEF